MGAGVGPFRAQIRVWLRGQRPRGLWVVVVRSRPDQA